MAISIISWLYVLSLPAWLVAAQGAASQAYTPVAGSCADGFTLVREAGSPGNQSLSKSEAAYVQTRRSQVLPQAWNTYLSNVQSTGVTLPHYVIDILKGSSSETPNLGIAVSGGSYRAAIFGAGVLNALDARNASSSSAGLGGLLQAAAYMTGLSGGSWTVTSLMQANFPTIQELIFGHPNPTSDSWDGWNADFDFLAPSPDPSTDAAYFQNLISELRGKYDVGFPVTLVDFWGRDLARHFLNGTSPSNFFDNGSLHGAGMLLSSLAGTELFASSKAPFPIIVSDLIAPGQNTLGLDPAAFRVAPLTNPIFEFNIYEMGSYDPMLSAFTPTKYLGTTNQSTCITNYDQLSLVMGASSDVFDVFNATNTLPPAVDTVISVLESSFPEPGIELDTLALPNPFYGVEPGNFISSHEMYLRLVDGGVDGEAIPLQPLLVEARNVDVILAIDANADVEFNFAAGGSLIYTQERTQLLSTAYSFPSVPKSVEEFTAQNLSTRPTFFGCETDNTDDTTPLLIYLANGGPPRNGEPSVTNTSFTQFTYSSSEIQAMLDQTLLIATQGFPENASATTDPEWPACLACAVVDRARERACEPRSGICESCFHRYCWNGSTLGSR